MHLDTLLETVTPQLFISAYANPSSVTQDGNNIMCEFQNVGTVRVHAGGFVSTDLVNSAFKAGSVIDIKAMTRENHSGWGVTYRESVGAIVRKFKNILPADMQDPRIIDRLADEALTKRKIFNACVCKSRPTSELPGGLLLRANNDFSGFIEAGGMSFLTSHDMMALESKLRAVGVNAKLPKSSALLVPYFSNAYSVAAIELIYGKRNSANDIIWIDNSTFGFSGLLAVREGDRCFLESNLGDAIADKKRTTEEFSSFFSVLHNPDGIKASWIPRNFFFVNRTNNPLELLTPAKLVKAGSSCVITHYPSVRDSAVMGNSIPWADAVTDTASKLLEEYNDFTPAVTLLLSTVRSDSTVKTRLKERLTAIGKYWLADRLDEELRDGAIWEDMTGCMYSTNHGYLWEDSANKRFGGALITNFTITPCHSIRYSTEGLYRAMNIHVGNESRHIMLSPTSFDTVKKFADKVEETIALSGNSTEVVPSVFDFVRARPILTWLQKVYADLPIMVGTSTLGWNPTRTKFTGTGFIVTENGTDTVNCIFRPGIDYLKYFSQNSSELEKGLFSDTIPPVLATLAYQCAGILVRSYSGHTLAPVTYSGDKTTREVLQRVFSYTGQLRAVQLNKNMRSMGDIDCLQGYPFLAQGYNRSQAKACKVGMILLGEEGTSIGPYSEDALKAAGKYIRYILETVPRFLIKNCGPSFLPAVGVITDSELAQEGKKVIDEMEL